MVANWAMVNGGAVYEGLRLMAILDINNCDAFQMLCLVCLKVLTISDQKSKEGSRLVVWMNTR